jgi:hypothetical protein
MRPMKSRESVMHRWNNAAFGRDIYATASFWRASYQHHVSRHYESAGTYICCICCPSLVFVSEDGYGATRDPITAGGNCAG